jgi:hypothetical protein
MANAQTGTATGSALAAQINASITADAEGMAFSVIPQTAPQWAAYEVEDPAFVVQRPVYSDVQGGDHVRGGSGGLPRAAVRYRIEAPDSQSLATQATLVATVRSYDRIDVTWGWPTKTAAWEEVALVRSGFGHPSTVNDGVTIFRSTRLAYSHVDDDGGPLSIVVNDEDLPSGYWFYYTLFFYVGGTWVPALGAEALVPRDFDHFSHLWNSVPPYYQWVDGRFRATEGYLNQFLHIFGFELDLTREYVESWQETYHTDKAPMHLLKRVGENLGLSEEQGLGEIRYRALVGQLSELTSRRGTPEGIRQLIEVSSKYATGLSTGRNMMLLPDDSDFSGGQGNWVLGASAGGTPEAEGGLSEAAGAAFNASVTVSSGSFARATTAEATGVANNALTAFTIGGGGSVFIWAETAVATGEGISGDTDYPITIEAPYPTDDKVPGYGTGVLRVTVPAELGTVDVIVVCGVGTLFTDDMREPKTLSPKFNGIPVKTDSLYGFSVQYKGPTPASAGIYWYDRHEVYISSDELLAVGPGEWQGLIVQADPPAGSSFAVPFVRQTQRIAGEGFMLMGAMFYRVGAVGSVEAFSPDYYLTMGSDDELIGTLPPSARVIGDG